MITKTVIKDYVAKRCPYLAFLELEDKTLVQLLEQSIEIQEKYKELALEQQQTENNEEPDEMFNLTEVFKDYPYLKEKVKNFAKYQPKNKAEALVEKYNDDQIVSKLSRRYFELKFGQEKCGRCDVNADGKELVNQEAIISLTKEYMEDPNIKVVFEGQIEYQDYRARFDVLIKKDDGTYSLIEVKGTNDVFKHPKGDNSIDTSIKDKYLYDMLFQYYVYQRAGLNISNLSFMFTNREFNMKNCSYPTADNELDDLFIVKDTINLKEGTISLQKYLDAELYIPKKVSEDERDLYTIEGIIDSIREIAKLKTTNPEMRYLCVKGPVCPFTKMCFDKNADDPNSMFKLTRWNLYGGDWRKSKKILDLGITKISEIPDNLNEFNEFSKDGKRYNVYTQIQYQKGKIKEKYIIDKSKIEDILKKNYMNDDIDYLLFFDFESFQYPIPLVERSPAWKQIVSQYSMHIVKKGYNLSQHDFEKGTGGGVTHYEYIANPDKTKYTNPSIELYETLKAQLEESGIDPYASNYKVVVFNENFEKTRMREFYDDFVSIADPELREFVWNFRENVVDLLDFFTSGAMYCRDFNGRGSLKVVQPTLADDPDVVEFYKKALPFDLAYSLDYHKGDKCLVYNGAICLDLYKSLLVRSHLGGQKKNEPSTDELLAEALAYCKIDSWGTVIIYDVIKNVYLGNLTLDALIK